MAKQPTNQDILNEVFRLGDLLEGDPNNWKDDGIKGAVKKNTTFRKSVQRVYWILIGGVMIGNIPVIWYSSSMLVELIRGL